MAFAWVAVSPAAETVTGNAKSVNAHTRIKVWMFRIMVRSSYYSASFLRRSSVNIHTQPLITGSVPAPIIKVIATPSNTNRGCRIKLFEFSEPTMRLHCHRILRLARNERHFRERKILDIAHAHHLLVLLRQALNQKDGTYFSRLSLRDAWRYCTDPNEGRYWFLASQSCCGGPTCTAISRL